MAHLPKVILFFFPATGFRFQFYSDVPDGVRWCYSVNDLFTVMFKNGHKGDYSLIYSFLEIVDSYLDWSPGLLTYIIYMRRYILTRIDTYHIFTVYDI